MTKLLKDLPAARKASAEAQAKVKAENTALNYDPADPDKMRLPKGTTCGDCAHIRRCSLMFGHTTTDTYCDWSPSRFRAAIAKAQGAPHE